MALEKIALEDDLRVSASSTRTSTSTGIVQRAIGIPVSLFTAIFALARTVGWIAQLNEMIGDPEYKIGRPRQLFTGSVKRGAPSRYCRRGCKPQVSPWHFLGPALTYPATGLFIPPAKIAGFRTVSATPGHPYDKIWDEHVVTRGRRHRVLYIDRHLVHEVTSPRLSRAARGLQAARELHRGHPDHNTPTTGWGAADGIPDPPQQVADRPRWTPTSRPGAGAFFPFLTCKEHRARDGPKTALSTLA